MFSVLEDHLTSLSGSPLAGEFLSNFITFFFGGTFYYFLLAGFSYYYIFIRYKDHYAPKFDTTQFEVTREIKTCLWNLFGEALLVSPLKMIVLRYSMTYHDFSQYGLSYFLVSLVLFWAWVETWTYWAHRWLHSVPFLYRRFHYVHHSFVATSPFAGFAFHPVDSFLQAVPTYTASFFFPVYWPLTMLHTVMISIWSVSIHDHVPMMPCKLFLYAPHHTIHHDEGRMKNYGLFTSIWDRIMNTYEDPDHIYFGYKDAKVHQTKIYEFKTGLVGDRKRQERLEKMQKRKSM